MGTLRGDIPSYSVDQCQAGAAACASFVPIGSIPQVNHTFAYFEATYGVLNEYQVGISESTCSGVFVSSPVPLGKALFSIDQLSQIAMERSKSSREAVQIMGSLSEQFGFYGESTSFEGGSESLVVSDKDEAWVFQILASPDGASSIWCAARVPDDSVSVVANMFNIREVDLNDTANFLGRADMWEIAEENNLWQQGMKKDWTATFSDGEYAHKYYSGRRMWGVFRLLSPSARLNPDYTNLKTDGYPFAVKVDELGSINPASMFSILRDHYQNTRFTTGEPNLAGGPYGTPDRFGNQNGGERQVQGNWERTIALYRTSDSYVVQSRSQFPDEVGGVVWFGSHAATATVYVPLFAAATQAAPDCLSWGWQGVMNVSSSFWTHRNIANLMQQKFKYMILDINAVQNKLESDSQSLVNQISSTYASMDDEEISSLMIANAVKAVDAYKQLFFDLLFKFSDGYLNYWENDAFVSSSSVSGYPAYWLESVGYENGPPPVSNTVGSSESKQQQIRGKGRTW